MFDALAALSARTSSLRFPLGLLAVGIVAIGVLLRRRLTGPSHRLPPGPKPLPIIGNVRDFPDGFEATHWAAHKELYGTAKQRPKNYPTYNHCHRDPSVQYRLSEKRSSSSTTSRLPQIC